MCRTDTVCSLCGASHSVNSGSCFSTSTTRSRTRCMDQQISFSSCADCEIPQSPCKFLSSAWQSKSTWNPPPPPLDSSAIDSSTRKRGEKKKHQPICTTGRCISQALCWPLYWDLGKIRGPLLSQQQCPSATGSRDGHRTHTHARVGYLRQILVLVVVHSKQYAVRLCQSNTWSPG